VAEIRERLPNSIREEEIKRLVERGVPRKKAEQLVDRIFGDMNECNPFSNFRRSAGKMLLSGALILLAILSLFSGSKKKKPKKQEEAELWI